MAQMEPVLGGGMDVQAAGAKRDVSQAGNKTKLPASVRPMALDTASSSRAGEGSPVRGAGGQGGRGEMLSPCNAPRSPQSVTRTEPQGGLVHGECIPGPSSGNTPRPSISGEEQAGWPFFQAAVPGWQSISLPENVTKTQLPTPHLRFRFSGWGASLTSLCSTALSSGPHRLQMGEAFWAQLKRPPGPREGHLSVSRVLTPSFTPSGALVLECLCVGASHTGCV